MAAFAVQVDKGCQRGLHLRYRLQEPSPSDALAAAGQAFPEAVGAVEAFGPRELRRLVVPFRFELRIGHAEGELSLLLRHSASPHQRHEDRQTIEALLSALPDQEGHA